MLSSVPVSPLIAATLKVWRPVIRRTQILISPICELEGTLSLSRRASSSRGIVGRLNGAYV